MSITVLGEEDSKCTMHQLNLNLDKAMFQQTVIKFCTASYLLIGQQATQAC